MALFGKMLKNAIGEGLSKAVEKAVEKAASPAVEKLAGAAAQQLNSITDTLRSEQTPQEAEKPACAAFADLEQAAQSFTAAAASAVWSGVLSPFPRWELCPVRDVTQDETGEYLQYGVFVDATGEQLDAYNRLLQEDGFTGDWQIMRKTVQGTKLAVDFTFAVPGDSDCQIVYYIFK